MNVGRLLMVLSVGIATAAPRIVGAEQPVSGSGATQPGGSSEITPTEESASPWGWLKMPSITMPKIAMPKMPADPLAPFKSSAKKVSEGGKKAWEGTKELFTFGGSKKSEPQARVASAAEPPSMMQRMFGGDEPAPKEGPATMKEWMSQPRVE